MKKIKTIIKKIDSVDVVLITALCLYGTFLITNLLKFFN